MSRTVCNPLLIVIFLFLTAVRINAQEHRFVLEVYAEMLYSHFDFGPDQKSGPNGAPPDSRSILDIPRFVPEIKYYFSEDLYFETEIEIEHGGTGSALELEFEEFGEFEQEIEKGGEIELEQFHVTKSFSTAFNLRLGHFILPIGLINTAHLPKEFFTTVRPEAETGIIPTTWHETGIELFGRFSNFAYQLQLVNGLDSSGFSSKFWIVGGRQTRFEQVKATDIAVVARLDYRGIPGVAFGLSAYRGNSTDNRPKPDMEGLDGHVTIWDAHLSLNRGPLTARGLLLMGFLENADLISSKNSRLSTRLEVPRTPIAKEARAWYGEIGYDILTLLAPGSKYKLYPFVRYEYYNTMQSVDAGIFADPRFERKLFTFGANFFLTPDVVLKTDYSHRTFGSDDINEENTFSIGLGFSADLLEL